MCVIQFFCQYTMLDSCNIYLCVIELKFLNYLNLSDSQVKFFFLIFDKSELLYLLYRITYFN